ncbi:hypothetical protein TSH58p_30035 (plasmid) [Azospirillum sp. TSH58]|uniref:DUF4258 domain-containing protein n=1 Tax=Azospirillum sp. TSH58 TaxID=664962 RepID=UPI000D6026FD|nr:DUF4258 domain-containing protein [Azospirillum sp. TSH58]AWJ87754.1 hypothetical protein TSH58p_30035 [Azospirillum sp. TSH58]PWC62117.1 hypothetical protein TSH58_25675 [Azospirillum sp. TSH58]
MAEFSLTPHAIARLQQRGMRPADVEMILSFGTWSEDGPVLCAKDYARVEADVRHFLARLQKLVGRTVIVEGDRIVTAYKAKPWKQKRLLSRR